MGSPQSVRKYVGEDCFSQKNIWFVYYLWKISVKSLSSAPAPLAMSRTSAFAGAALVLHYDKHVNTVDVHYHVNKYLSLSLSIYIYIYMCIATHICYSCSTYAIYYVCTP